VRSRLRSFADTAAATDLVAILEEDADPAGRIEIPRGPARRLFEPRYELDYFPASDVLRFAEPGAVGICEPGRSTIRIVVRPGDAHAAFAGSHVFLTLSLFELLKRRDRFAVHAGAVARDGRAILIAGPSGVGKTTLAVAAALDGFELLGDDMALLRHQRGEDSIGLAAFPDEIDLAAGTIDFFGELEPALADVQPGLSGKRSLHPLDLPGVRIAWTARPAALVFPTAIRARPAKIRPISADDALARLVANIVRTEHASTQRHLDAFAVLGRSIASFELDIADPREAPPVFSEILRTS
jgi:hypothetical protein